MIPEQVHAVPNLTTALTGPLLEIESHMLMHQAEIEQWFRGQWLSTQAPFYASVDLRNAGFKLAPVDTNLFPAGFNNLSGDFEPLCVHAMQTAAERLVPNSCGALLIPEDHTRNPHYWQSIARLVRILELAGFRARIGSLSPDLTEPAVMQLPGGQTLLREPISRHGDKVLIGDFTPCFILLNNDLSAGLPAVLENISQPVVPPVALGWATRRKSHHFGIYDQVANEFSALIEIDPWLINPLFRRCGQIDFQKREGEDCLVMNVAELLLAVRDKYRAYGIDQEPFAFVKADSGTYGMNIMVVRSPDEVRDLNRKQRNKMARGKGGATVTEVMVQEGVYTFEKWGPTAAVAEPVVYMIDHFVVGGFYRVHTERAADDNLNSPGMHFEPLAFAESCSHPDDSKDPDAQPNRFYAYGVVARLALLAAARERQGLQLASAANA
jgi:glutamate--cysteine ligase